MYANICVGGMQMLGTSVLEGQREVILVLCSFVIISVSHAGQGVICATPCSMGKQGIMGKKYDASKMQIGLVL